MKKRTIWTPNGIQTQYVEKKEPSSNPPGYARPKSAGMGRSKSGGISAKNSGEHSSSKEVPTPVLNRQILMSGPNLGSGGHGNEHGGSNGDRWNTSYRLHYGLAAAVNAGGNVESEKQRSSNSSHQHQQANVPVKSDAEAGVDQGSYGRPTSASSRIRAAINLGQQYNTQVATRTQAVEAAAAVARDKTTTSATGTGGTTTVMRPSSAPSAARPTSANKARKTTAAMSGNDVIPDDDDDDDDEEYDHMGEGRDADGGLGTDEGFARHGTGTDSRSNAPSHPEVSTPSASLELGEKSSMSAAAHVSADLRNYSSIEEGGADYPHLSTLPNQFCSVKEASELQKIVLSCSRHKSRPPTAGPASTALMDMYMVGKIVGVGSYGKVRAAWHRLTSCKVAIKTYDKSKLKDPEHWKRVQSEIKIMEDVSHPRIARLYEAVETPKRVHLIMECLEGGNLCSYVKSKRRLSEDESKRIFFQLTQALDHLHQHCIIHRDIKLENVLFDRNKDIKLIDFGFSTVSPDGKKLRVFCGTPSYMAPEIVRRTEYEGKPVDMWGLGILLYALLCGCFPFRAKSYPDLYRRIARGSFTIPDELSSPVRDLIRQLLTVDPYTRISSANVLRHPWLHHQMANAPDMNKIQTDTAILISDRPADDIHDGVINELAEFGVEKDDIVRQVMGKTHSSLATLYYLLLHTIKGDSHKSSSSHSHGERRPSSSGVVSSGTDVTKRYDMKKDSNGSSSGNIRPISSSGTDTRYARPRSASANRPGGSGSGSHQHQRPRSASSGRRTAHNHYA